MELRPYIEADVPLLASIYRDAIRTTASDAYTAPEVESWATFADDPAVLREQLAQGTTLLAMVDGEVAGFGQLHPTDRIALLYTAPRFGRRGVATCVYRELELTARADGQERLRTEASRISRHFFGKMGFVVDGTETKEYSGTSFVRFRMSRQLER